MAMEHGGPVTWTREATERLDRVPEGPMRELARQRVEAMARRHGSSTITGGLVESKYGQWRDSDRPLTTTLDWSERATERVDRIPSFVRGSVIGAIERYAISRGAARVTSEIVDESKRHWKVAGHFHQP